MTARTAARNFAAALVICAGMVSVGSSAQACKTAETEFSTRLRKTAEGCVHPLCGQIHVIDKAALARDTSCGGDPLIALMSDWLGARLSGVMIVGETHDNPLHHELQADLLRSDPVPVADDKAGVVFEQFRADQQPVFDKIAAEPTPPTLEEFKRVTNWEKSGWQQYKYDPLLQAAIDLRLPLYAGDVPREAIMKVAKEGPEALPADERARLKLDTPLGAKLDEASLIEIEENHCGLMPKEALKPMAFAQRYRDAHLADATLKAVGKHGSAVLITGTGHARTDRGVPWYIRQRAPDRKVVSVMLTEVEDGKTDPETYVPRGPDGKPAADYIIFTPRADRPDPCEKMREQMHKK